MRPEQQQKTAINKRVVTPSSQGEGFPTPHRGNPRVPVKRQKELRGSTDESPDCDFLGKEPARQGKQA